MARITYTAAEKLAHALHGAASCTNRLEGVGLSLSARELFEDSRQAHLRDALRLQKKIAKAEASHG